VAHQGLNSRVRGAAGTGAGARFARPEAPRLTADPVGAETRGALAVASAADADDTAGVQAGVSASIHRGQAAIAELGAPTTRGAACRVATTCLAPARAAT